MRISRLCRASTGQTRRRSQFRFPPLVHLWRVCTRRGCMPSSSGPVEGEAAWHSRRGWFPPCRCQERVAPLGPSWFLLMQTVTWANTARPCTLRLRLLGMIWWNRSSGEAAECPSAARWGLCVLALPSWAPQAWTQKRLQPGSRRRPLGGGPRRAPGAELGSAQLCLQTDFSSLSVPHACFSSTDPLSIPRRGTRGPTAGLTTTTGALVYPRAHHCPISETPTLGKDLAGGTLGRACGDGRGSCAASCPCGSPRTRFLLGRCLETSPRASWMDTAGVDPGLRG